MVHITIRICDSICSTYSMVHFMQSLPVTFVLPISVCSTHAKEQYWIDILSHDVASGSDITLFNKIGKPLMVYRFSGNVMTSIIMLRKRWQNLVVFTPKCDF